MEYLMMIIIIVVQKFLTTLEDIAFTEVKGMEECLGVDNSLKTANRGRR